MNEKRCTVCGALRINGACSLIGCRDPLFDQREEDKIAAAEERGRRRGLDADAEAHMATIKALHAFRCLLSESQDELRTCDRHEHRGLVARIEAALAPRVPHGSEGPPCAYCAHAKWRHQHSSKEHAFCSEPIGLGYCQCKNYLAPRDSGKEG